MKKDFKEFLVSGEPLAEKINKAKNTPEVFTETDIHNLWKIAQRKVWEKIIKEFDNDMDSLLGYKNKAVGGKAQLVAYIGTLKSFFKQKQAHTKE